MGAGRRPTKLCHDTCYAQLDACILAPAQAQKFVGMILEVWASIVADWAQLDLLRTESRSRGVHGSGWAAS